MTEEEAKKKWCPFVRVDSEGNNRSVNIGPHTTDLTVCVGSACMAWRWAGRLIDERVTGYCGLARRP